MHEYDFVSRNVSEDQVRSIIGKAGYNPKSYTYAPRVGRDGYLVKGSEVMSLTELRNAARELKINVEISSPNLAAMAEDEAASVDEAAVGATDYQVSITMSPETVQALLGGNYFLYGFKAVQTAQGGGAPLVWFQTKTYSTSTEVAWQEQFQAYTSTSQIVPNGRITASFATDIDLGHTLEVEQGGIGPVVSGGPKGTISILNQTSTQFTCGISQMQNGSAKSLCAFPLYGNGLDVIAPIQKVLLTFSSLPVNTGTVIFPVTAVTVSQNRDAASRAFRPTARGS